MDRAHRHDLKHDKFVEQVGHTVEFAAEHKKQLTRWGGLAAAALLLGIGAYSYTRYQAGVRQDELRHAVRVQEAAVGPSQSEFVVSFATEAEKTAAVQKAWTELANKYPGKEVGMIAHHYMAVNAADKGNIQEAEKHFKIVADGGDKNYASQAKLSLAQIYDATGREAEAEKLLRELIASPTPMVAKEQATVALARAIADSKPAEARKLLEPLRTERGAVSRTAIGLLGEIPAR